MRLPMIEVTRPQLEGLIIMAGLSFWVTDKIMIYSDFCTKR
jgi:hypothetical protein